VSRSRKRSSRQAALKKAPASTLGAARPGPRHWPLWLAGILLLTFLVYLPSLDNGFTNWDDNHYVTENPLVAHPDAHAVLTTPVAGNYHPLTIASLALNYRISGLRPASYHWLNLLLHLANTALVFLFIWTLSGQRFWTSAVTSLFFGIHPMHVESVAWVAERKDVLFVFFYLLGLIAYLRYLRGRQLVWLGAAFLACVLSAASKPAAVVFPITLLAIDLYRRRKINLTVVLEKAPFFFVSVVVGLLTLQAQRLAGAIPDSDVWSPFQRLLFACHGLVMYVVKFFVPVSLSALDPYPNSPSGGLGPEFYLAFAAVVILVPAAVFLFRKNRAALFGLAFFVINIALVLQFFAVGGALMADRYTYLPYVGLLFAFAWPLDARPGAGRREVLAKRLVAGCCVIMLPAFLFLSWRRSDVWKDSMTLWEDVVRKRPEGARGWNYRGVTWNEQSRFDLAYEDFDRAVKLKPHFAEARNNRGAIELRRGDLQGALADFSLALQANARYRDAYTNRALAYSMLGEHEKSIADTRRAIELNPRNRSNYVQYGYMGDEYQALQRHQEAIAGYSEAIRTAPAGEAHVGGYFLSRSRSWAALGDRGRALSDAREAVRLGASVDSTYMRQIGAP
jgi:tetratricopeptide (TPR) repeat protein